MPYRRTLDLTLDADARRLVDPRARRNARVSVTTKWTGSYLVRATVVDSADAPVDLSGLDFLFLVARSSGNLVEVTDGDFNSTDDWDDAAPEDGKLCWPVSLYTAEMQAALGTDERVACTAALYARSTGSSDPWQVVASLDLVVEQDDTDPDGNTPTTGLQTVHEAGIELRIVAGRVQVWANGTLRAEL